LWQQIVLIPDRASRWSDTLLLRLSEDYKRGLSNAGIHMSKPRTVGATILPQSSTLED